jgi:hypothetical protein
MTDLYDQFIGIPWFRRELYDNARITMADSASLPEIYDVWLERAEKREQQIRSSGATPNRVYVDDDQFVVFCRERNAVLDSKSRMNFAAQWALGMKANVTDYEHPGFRHGAKRKQ